uniref:receptor-type tyrosine-protein phosphatase eta isoform X3 n=1 Tax=Gasterosteus aculeatus aculeatus TaxID=481459 RepID=UPI001A99E839|nr:receptor-type tyrosine-protein phosphatase eta isoform X3 [Gasterosteus aculeatus aculeatus]
MKLALLSSVPLRTLLLVFSAVLGIAQVAEADTTTSTDGNATDSNSGTTTSISISNVTSEGSTVEQTTSVSLFTKPEVVRNITVTNVTTSSISLTWNDPKGNSSSYRVQWTDSVDTTSITITNLTAGVQYKITVAAVTNEGSTEGQNTSVSQYTSK